jgi:hypothetical protein
MCIDKKLDAQMMLFAGKVAFEAGRLKMLLFGAGKRWASALR